jgi:hypothetical protein
MTRVSERTQRGVVRDSEQINADLLAFFKAAGAGASCWSHICGEVAASTATLNNGADLTSVHAFARHAPRRYRISRAHLLRLYHARQASSRRTEIMYVMRASPANLIAAEHKVIVGSLWAVGPRSSAAVA